MCADSESTSAYSGGLGAGRNDASGDVFVPTLARHGQGAQELSERIPWVRPQSAETSVPVSADLSDAALLRGVAADDEQCLRIFYRRHAGLVYSLAYRMLRNGARAEDVLQETFIRVWRAAITFDPARGTAESWVVTIARNLCLSSLRKARSASLDAHLDEASEVPDDGETPEQAAWRNARRDLVRAAVARLPEQQRHLVALAYFDGLTHVEIAARTRQPLGTVKSRLRLALIHLRRALHASLGDAWQELADAAVN